jgi:preprotein translocase subunit SecG
MQKIFGLPAHLLMVHLPVVLIPAVALAAMLIAVRREWRGRFGLATAGASLLSVGAVILAKQSGEGMFILMNEAPDINRHKSLANATVILTILLFVAIVTMVYLHRRAGKRTTSPLAVAVSVITIALAVLATVGTIATGHEGAKIASEQIGTGG